MKEIEELISTVGFPIACCVAMGYVLWKVYNKMVATLDRVTETNSELTKTNSKLAEKINAKIDTLEDKVDKIVDKIL
ncbi:MAG: iduronate sulfatase [Clostridium baratii]